jgi:hypothetical protein
MGEERTRILNLIAEGKITAEEASRLLDALDSRGTQTAVADPPARAGSSAGAPKFMYVKVVSQQGDNVNVKIPLSLVRAGLKLTSLIPPQAMEQITKQMADHGMAFDFANLKQEDIEELIEALREMEVNVDSKNGDNVRVYCA